jgi:hypothetical protein
VESDDRFNSFAEITFPQTMLPCAVRTASPEFSTGRASPTSAKVQANKASSGVSVHSLSPPDKSLNKQGIVMRYFLLRRFSCPEIVCNGKAANFDNTAAGWRLCRVA